MALSPDARTFLRPTCRFPYLARLSGGAARAGVLLAVVSAAILLFASSPARGLNPLYIGNYDGAEDRVLATSAFGDITERDLLLFLVMSDNPVPDVLWRYLHEPLHSQRRLWRERLHAGLEDFIMLMAAADQELWEKYPAGIEEEAAEFSLYPVYEWVWADHVASHDLQLTRSDMLKFYHAHQSQFARRPTWQARVIFRRADIYGDDGSVEEAENLLLRLRDEAQGGVPFEALAREYSQAPSAAQGGLLPPLAEGTLFAEFEDVLSELTPGEVSEPFMGIGGVYMVQLLSREPGRLMGFDESIDDILMLLQPHALRYRQVWATEQMARSLRNAYRPLSWFSPSDEDWVVRVGDYRLTSGDLQRLQPDIMTDNALTDRPLLQRAASKVFVGRLARQECEARNLMQDERINRARQLAPLHVRMRRLIAERQQPYRNPGAETLKAFYHSRSELFEASPYYSLTRVSATLRTTDTLTPIERLDLVSDVSDQMETLVRQQSLLLRSLDRQAQIEAGASTDTVLAQMHLASYVETFSAIDPLLFDVRIDPISGYYDRNNLPEDFPAAALDELEAYDTVGPAPIDDRAVFWICESVRRVSLEDDLDAGLDIVAREYERVMEDAGRREVLNEALAIADVTWVYQTLPFEPTWRMMPPATIRAVQARTPNGS